VIGEYGDWPAGACNYLKPCIWSLCGAHPVVYCGQVWPVGVACCLILRCRHPPPSTGTMGQDFPAVGGAVGWFHGSAVAALLRQSVHTLHLWQPVEVAGVGAGQAAMRFDTGSLPGQGFWLHRMDKTCHMLIMSGMNCCL